MKGLLPISYEDEIVQKRTQILRDPLQELLLFPQDDISVRNNIVYVFCFVIALQSTLVSFAQKRFQPSRCQNRLEKPGERMIFFCQNVLCAASPGYGMCDSIVVDVGNVF